MSITCHFIFLVSCIHASYKTSSEMLNVEFIFKRLRNMGHQWEAQLSAMENVQEKFIQEMEEQLTRLTNLFEDMAVHPRGPSPSPNQQVPRPFVQTTSYLPRRIDCPNLRQPTPTAPSAFMTTSRPANQPSSSKSKPNRQEIDKNKP